MTNLPLFLQNPFLVKTSMWLFLLIITWSLFWKGWALWRAARTGQKWWFIVILLINTVGILEILYLFVFGKKENISLIKTEEKKDDLPMMPPTSTI